MVGTPPSRLDDMPDVEPNGHWERGITNIHMAHGLTVGSPLRPHHHEGLSELEFHRVHKPLTTGGQHPDHDESAVYEKKTVTDLFRELRGHAVTD